MTHFITDEHGNRTFEHAGWQVRIWSGRGDIPTVTAPGSSEWVEIWPEGIRVYGESRVGRETSPRAVIIPWPVVEAIVAARAIVG